MFKKLFILFSLCLNLFATNVAIDTITLEKIKSSVQKEEEIASAYKKYLLDKAQVPTITNLRDNGYLPKGFSTINPFGKSINILNKTITNTIPDDLKLNVYDYYYSDKYRKNTKAPLNLSSNVVKIILDTKEKYIYDHKNEITIDGTNPTNKFYLEKGVLHWYDLTGKYIFSYANDLIVDKDVTIADENGNYNAIFLLLIQDKGLFYAGEKILQEKDGVIEDYLITDNGLIQLDEALADIGKTIIQFTRRAGGMIVNGDIYTWGNNANRITSLDLDTYTKQDGSVGSKYPVISALVRAKVKTTYSYNNKYFSSPLRPKFVDFFSTVYAGTCGISIDGALYCGGSTGYNYSFGTMFTHTDSQKNGEMLYKSTYFDGTLHKAKKIFSNNQIWHILDSDGYINIWGYDWGSGFSGNGYSKYNYSWNILNTSLNPVQLVSDTITGVKFKDISYLLTIGYRKIGALSTTGDIYIWGIESQNSYNNCSVTWENQSMNLCKPLKITSTTPFVSFQGGLESFVALGEDKKYYKIYQPKDKKPQVIDLNNAITSYTEYDITNDSEIISVDISSKLVSGLLQKNSGIVWINANNELKGDYFSNENENDNLFKDAIKTIKWKKIKVIDDNNGMCGIDIYNQMYCWGIMSYYRDGSSDIDANGNTFMIPVFNTNLYDVNKDYLISEGGSNGSTGYLTNLTSGDWSTTDSDGHTGAFFMKYPTYIGGFNYEFEFK